MPSPGCSDESLILTLQGRLKVQAAQARALSPPKKKDFKIFFSTNIPQKKLL